MKRLRKDCGGFTLVEIMATFTLTAIFMSLAALVLSTFMKSHTVASAVAIEQNVSSIVMETITSNLGAARWGPEMYDGKFNPAEISPPELTEEQKNAKASLLIGSSDPLSGGTTNSEVWYIDGETENIVHMYVKQQGESGKEKSYLAMDYYVKPEVGAPESTEWECVPWQLGEGVYQNCSIKSFKVEQLEASDDSGSGNSSSCLSVTIVLKNGVAGEDNTYTLNRTFDCYNLAPENIVKLTS